MVGSVHAGSLATTAAGSAPDPAKLKEAAKQFEALLIAQLLKGMRGSEGWLGTGEDQAGESMLEIAQEHLAQVMANQGGLGLAGLLIQGLDVQANVKPVR